MSVKERAYVLSQDMCAEGIFSLWLETEQMRRSSLMM